MKPKESSCADEEILSALARRRNFTTETVRAVMLARQMLVLAMTSAIVKLRESAQTAKQRLAQDQERDLRILELEDRNALLEARISRIDAKRRSRYTPEERFNILVHKETYSRTFEEAAESFLLSPQTIKRWFDQAVKEPARKTVGSLLKATPPLMKYSDVIRSLVRLLEQIGFGGNKRIAETLARAGVKLSRETVRRYRKLPRKPEPRPLAKTNALVLKARSPNHIWMMDITEISGRFRLFTFKLVVLLDVFSRFPLAARLFFKEPTAQEISEIIKAASKKHGVPRHFISDQGSQFTSLLFCNVLARLGIKQRFGAIGKTGSIVIIERFWRTMKEMLLLKLRPPLSIHELWRRVEIGLVYYALWKPHQALSGATPSEMYYGQTPAHIEAKRPRRDYELKGESDKQLFEISYLDPDCLLPALKKEA